MSASPNHLIILCGIPFSGKTNLANALAQDLDCLRIDLDEIKQSHVGRDHSDDQIVQAEWDEIYQEMYRQIESALREGKSVVHDTGNFTVYERGLIRDIATTLGVRYMTIYVDTPIKVAQERMKKNRETQERFDVSDSAFDEAVTEMEPPIEVERPIVYDKKMSYEELFIELKKLSESYYW